MATTSIERDRYWDHWCEYTQPLGFDPYMQQEPHKRIVRVASGFAGRVRTGYYGRKRQVSCARVQVAMRAIGQTCELDLNRNPLYRAPEKYLKQLEIMFAGFRREDPIPLPEIAVPVSVPQFMAKMGLSPSATPKEQAVGDLALIAFFYLLRVGEYTQKKKRKNTRTVQFRLCDIAFKKGNTIIPRDAPPSELLQATAATLRLSNQKNGIRGSLIHRSAALGPYCPVKALVRRFLHLRDNNADENDIISSFWDHLGQSHVTDVNMRTSIRAAVTSLGLTKQGITPTRVGTHSFRAGGAMALRFANASRDDIKKMGRWSSDTFLIYIQDQIAEYSEGWTNKMATPRSYFNLEGAFSQAPSI